MPLRSASPLRIFARASTLISVLYAIGLAPPMHAQVPDGVDSLALTLDAVVGLALENSRDIQNAHHLRRSQAYDLMVAEDRFIPDLVLSSDLRTGGLNTEVTGLGESNVTRENLDFGATVVSRIPTGGLVSVGWSGTGVWEDTDGFPGLDPGGHTVDLLQGGQIRFEQPLLRGGGLNTGLAPLRIARAQDASAEQDLRRSLMGIITNTILAYREVLRARGTYEIANRALLQTRQTLELNSRLVEAGRMAQIELVQSETEAANREVSLSIAANALEQARFELLQYLDLDRRLVLIPLDSLGDVPDPPDEAAILEHALASRPEYVRAQQQLAVGQLSRTLALNNRLWDVNAVAEYTRFFNDEAWKPTFGLGPRPLGIQEGWSLGLNVRYTLGDRTRRQQAEQARLQVGVLENRLRDLREQVRIEMEGALRDVTLRRQQVDLARRARELSEQQLAVEEEKLATGRSSNFQVLTYQDNLFRARVSELDAQIAYRNALTLLDFTLGTTLETWGLEQRAP